MVKLQTFLTDSIFTHIFKILLRTQPNVTELKGGSLEDPSFKKVLTKAFSDTRQLQGGVANRQTLQDLY